MASKRPASSTSAPTSKRAKLDGWLSLPAEALAEPIVPGCEVIAGDSTFVAHAAPIRGKAAALRFRQHIRDAHLNDPASHEMVAWRTLDLRPGADGTGGPDDFVVHTGSDEDGEKYSGQHLLKALEQAKAVDVAVVCSRWFGGQMLGPARFEHIRTVARDAIAKLLVAIELDDLRDLLLAKDAKIVDLAGIAAPASPGKDPYADLDVVKARRLIVARDKRIALLESHAKAAAEKESLAAGDVEEQLNADEELP